MNVKFYFQSTQIDPEDLFTKLERIGKGSFGEVRVMNTESLVVLCFYCDNNINEFLIFHPPFPPLAGV